MRSHVPLWPKCQGSRLTSVRPADGLLGEAPLYSRGIEPLYLRDRVAEAGKPDLQEGAAVTQASTEPDVLHIQAVQARLAAVTDYPVYVGEDEIPARIEPTGYPYVVAWAASGVPVAADERMRGYSGAVQTQHQVTVVALTPLDVVGAAARVRNGLHRWHPAITGRRCSDITMDSDQPAPPTVDPSVKGPQGQPIYIAYLTLSFASTLNNS